MNPLVNNSKISLITGNEACAHAALAAGMRFFAGYPITPSTEIAEVLSRLLPKEGGVFIQMEDEIASIAAIIGASLAGVKVMTATSGPGFSLMQENIGYAAMAEVPCVIVNVQRGGPSTGLPTLPSQGDSMQARWGTHGDHPVIVVTPSTVRDIYEWTIRSFNLAEYYLVPVIILLDEVIAHISEKVVFPEPKEIEIVNREAPSGSEESYLPYRPTSLNIPSFAAFGSGYRRHVTGLCHNEAGFPTNDPVTTDALIRRLQQKIESNREQIIAYREESTNDADVCVVAYGSCARSARRAVKHARCNGIQVGLFQPLVLWPFPYQRLNQLAEQIHTFVVPEMNLGQIAHEVTCATQRTTIPINRVDGTLITPAEIEKVVQNVSVR